MNQQFVNNRVLFLCADQSLTVDQCVMQQWCDPWAGLLNNRKKTDCGVITLGYRAKTSFAFVFKVECSTAEMNKRSCDYSEQEASGISSWSHLSDINSHHCTETLQASLPYTFIVVLLLE